jgi:ribose 5-phosphate isomerase A
MVLGLGTGSTAACFVQALGEAVHKGLKITGIPSSKRTEELARSLHIPLVGLDDVDAIDLSVDGADEVDPGFHLIKGGGGALVREKILASISRSLAIIVDPSKIVECLGKAFPLPVEVIPYGEPVCRRALESLGAEVTRREGFVTDNGNLILDCKFDGIPDPALMEARINAISGVVDNGLFVGMAQTVIIGREDGAEVLRKGQGPISCKRTDT